MPPARSIPAHVETPDPASGRGSGSGKAPKVVKDALSAAECLSDAASYGMAEVARIGARCKLSEYELELVFRAGHDMRLSRIAADRARKSLAALEGVRS